jgi:hypothetical protein
VTSMPRRQRRSAMASRRAGSPGSRRRRRGRRIAKHGPQALLDLPAREEIRIDEHAAQRVGAGERRAAEQRRHRLAPGGGGTAGGARRAAPGSPRRRHEHPLALPRLQQPARDQLVVGGLHGVLREPELLLEHAHRRHAAPGGQAAGADLRRIGLDDLLARHAAAGRGRRDVHADVGRAGHAPKHRGPRAGRKGQRPGGARDRRARQRAQGLVGCARDRRIAGRKTGRACAS